MSTPTKTEYDKIKGYLANEAAHTRKIEGYLYALYEVLLGPLPEDGLSVDRIQVELLSAVQKLKERR